jgi:hypothetical protein
MKKYFLIIAILVLGVGFSAFKFSGAGKKAEKMQIYTWHKYNAAGTSEIIPAVTYTGTAAGAKSSFGCPDGNTVNCARAYDSEGNPLNIYVKKSPQ